MDITKFYELRTRLYASAASGCGAVNEDFRLRRAIEAFEPLAQANKAFMKLYSDCNKLFASESPANLLSDCIALADALAVVQGGYSDNSETDESRLVSSDTANTRFTYSEIKEAVSKLSAVNLMLFYDGNAKKELFTDNRVLAAFLKMLDRTELPAMSFIFEENYGRRLVSVLKNNMPSFSDKARVNSIRLIGKVAGAEENELYTALANDEDQSKEVRAEAVLAMKYSPENAERLKELYYTEKGKIKSAALMALSRFDIPETEEIWEKLLKSGRTSDLKPLTASCSHVITEYVRKEIGGAVDDFRNSSNSEQSRRIFKLRDMLRFTYDCEDILILLIKQDLLVNDINELLIENIREYPDDEGYRQLVEKVFAKCSEVMPAWLLMNIVSDGKCLYGIDELVTSDMSDPLIRIAENIRYCGAVGKYIVPFSYLYPRGSNWAAVGNKTVERIAELMMDIGYIRAYSDLDENPVERRKTVKALGSEDKLHLSYAHIMSMANRCSKCLENIDEKKAIVMAAVTVLYCPGISSVGVLHRKDLLNPENSQGIFERYILFIAQHFTLKTANTFSKLREAEQIMRLLPMADEQKLSELYDLKKELKTSMLAADADMVEASRKFTDEMILQFENKTKDTQK